MPNLQDNDHEILGALETSYPEKQSPAPCLLAKVELNLKVLTPRFHRTESSIVYSGLLEINVLEYV